MKNLDKLLLCIIIFIKAEIDELNAARVQEEVEREWRRREKEEVLKKLETQERLKKSREEQINDKRVMQAMEMAREKQEFHKVLSVQKKAVQKETQEREKRLKEKLKHRTEILKQVVVVVVVFLIKITIF